TRIYGQDNPPFTAHYSGFVLGEDATVLSGNLSFSTQATRSSNAGSYAIIPSGLSAGNYALTFANGTLTVTSAALTITAKDASKTYGQSVTFAGTEFTSSGLVNGDSVTSATLTSAGAAATASVGTYPIVASAAAGSGLGNYTISYVDGTLTVKSA